MDPSRFAWASVGLPDRPRGIDVAVRAASSVDHAHPGAILCTDRDEVAIIEAVDLSKRATAWAAADGQEPVAVRIKTNDLAPTATRIKATVATRVDWYVEARLAYCTADSENKTEGGEGGAHPGRIAKR